MSNFETYRERRKITEYKDGCVYKTKHVSFVWVDMDEATCYEPDKDGFILCSVSNSPMPRRKTSAQ